MPVPTSTPGIHAGGVQNQEDGSDGSEIEATEGRLVGVQGLLSANYWQAQVVGDYGLVLALTDLELIHLACAVYR